MIEFLESSIDKINLKIENQIRFLSGNPIYTGPPGNEYSRFLDNELETIVRNM